MQNAVILINTEKGQVKAVAERLADVGVIRIFRPVSRHLKCRHAAAHAVGGGTARDDIDRPVCSLGTAGGGHHRQCAGLGAELAAGSLYRALPAQALVSRQRRLARKGLAGLSPLRSLLLSWVPIIGDPLTVVAGVMRETLSSFLLIVTLAKAAGYLLLAVVTLGWLG